MISRREKLEREAFSHLCDPNYPRELAVRELQTVDARAVKRPRRSLPLARKIAAFWFQRGSPFEVQMDTPECFRCGLRVEAWNNLDRAHLVDRCLGGLDNEPNLAMLCRFCHRQMPPFGIDQWHDAIQYALNWSMDFA